MRTKSKMPSPTPQRLGVKRVQFKESVSMCKKKPRQIEVPSQGEVGEVVCLGELGSQKQEIIPCSQESSIQPAVAQEAEAPTPPSSEKELEEGLARTVSDAEYEVNTQAWPDTDSSQDPKIYENYGVFVSVPANYSSEATRTFTQEELDDMQSLPY